MKSIYETELLNVTPQPTWLYEVEFYFTNGPINGFSDITKPKNMIKLTPTSITLPQKEIVTKDVYFCGKKKSVPVYANLSGDLSCDFLVTPETIRFFFYSMPGEGTRRPEYENQIAKMSIKVLNGKGKVSYIYNINNPIITTIEHSESLGFDTEEMMKLSVTIHYNSWSCDIIEPET